MLKRMIKNNPLVSYFIMAYTITWILLIPIIINIISENYHFLGAFGPAISAVLVLYFKDGKRGIYNLTLQIKKYRIKFTWILISISPIFLLLISLPIGYLVSGEWFNFTKFFKDKFYSFSSIFLWLLPLISYGVFEEIGWRGFALPSLQKKFSAFTATFVLSILWFFWHLPMFFYRFNFNIGMVFGFYLGLLSGSIIFTFIFNSTKGNVLMTIIWHTLWNIVATLDVILLTSIMSFIIIFMAILILLRYGKENLSPNEKFILSYIK